MREWEKDINQIKDGLTMDEAHRLILADLPMILTPRMFFVSIQKKVEEVSGTDAAQFIFYQAAFESAYKYLENSKEVYAITGRDLLQQYLDSLSARGWGEFEILELVEERGEGRVRLNHSAISEEYGETGQSVCHVWAGALAGSIKLLAEECENDTEVRGVETHCLSKGDSYCEFIVEPVEFG